MRKTADLVLIILAALVLINMPAFKGLSIIQLNRPSDLPVGADPGGALGIIGLDQGLSGAIAIGSGAGSADRYIGTIANNFDFPVQLVTEVAITAVIIRSGGNPRWQNTSIFFDKVSINNVRVRVATLSYANFGVGTSTQVMTTGAIVLTPGETLVVSLDRNSRLHQRDNIGSFQAEAFFSIIGSRTGDENISFTIRPINNLRKQYFAIQ